MDMEHNAITKKSKLGTCEVCADKEAKYTCPECAVKTCSLPCSTTHKKQLNCNGIRNKVSFKPLDSFTDCDFQSDYMLLEDMGRRVESIQKQTPLLQPTAAEAKRCTALLKAAHKRNIKLQLLPNSFSRHQSNSTYYKWNEDILYWKVKWIFPESEGFSVTDSRIIETETIASTVSKYIGTEPYKDIYKVTLQPYQKAGLSGCKVLLKAEKVAGNKFFLMNSNETILKNLQSKIIIENPVFYVILADKLSSYNIVHLISRKKAMESKNLLMNVELDE